MTASLLPYPLWSCYGRRKLAEKQPSWSLNRLLHVENRGNGAGIPCVLTQSSASVQHSEAAKAKGVDLDAIADPILTPGRV